MAQFHRPLPKSPIKAEESVQTRVDLWLSQVDECSNFVWLGVQSRGRMKIHATQVNTQAPTWSRLCPLRSQKRLTMEISVTLLWVLTAINEKGISWAYAPFF